jgi:hypothetical protein
LVNEQAFNYILRRDLGARRGTIPAAEPGKFDRGLARMPVYIVGLVCFTAVAAALVYPRSILGIDGRAVAAD